MKLTEEQEKNKNLLAMGGIETEQIPAEYLYAIELMAEMPTLTNGEFLEFKSLLEERLWDEWCRRFGNPKAYLEMRNEKKRVDE